MDQRCKITLYCNALGRTVLYVEDCEESLGLLSNVLSKKTQNRHDSDSESLSGHWLQHNPLQRQRHHAHLQWVADKFIWKRFKRKMKLITKYLLPFMAVNNRLWMTTDKHNTQTIATCNSDKRVHSLVPFLQSTLLLTFSASRFSKCRNNVLPHILLKQTNIKEYLYILFEKKQLLTWKRQRFSCFLSCEWRIQVCLYHFNKAAGRKHIPEWWCISSWPGCVP